MSPVIIDVDEDNISQYFLKTGSKKFKNWAFSRCLLNSEKKAIAPRIKDCEWLLSNYEGLKVVYSNQCPWVAQFMSELPETIKETGEDRFC